MNLSFLSPGFKSVLALALWIIFLSFALSGCGGSSEEDDQKTIPCISQGTPGICTVTPACVPLPNGGCQG